MTGRTTEDGSVDGMQYMLLRQRVSQAMDSTGWSSVLILLDVALSFLSVLLYIVQTYDVQVLLLYDIDFALAIFFALNWLFWFWLAEDRLRYVFSFLSLVDAVTIIPAFVLYSLEGEMARSIPGLNFLRILRILRILRVFRMRHVVQRHLEGAVVEAAGKLVFSLLSILFIAAGLFYELEKFGPSDPNTDSQWKSTLMFHEALYWASVTLTTVGYGDFSPTWWATQMMLIILLILTFSVLPYLTGELMDALGSSTHYQRARFTSFSRRSDVGHVVFMGALDGTTMEGLMNELYHEDKGFNHQHCVFLNPGPPGMEQRHVMAAHHAASKMHYLQGSPFRTEDLSRAACEYASAIFLIAPKHAEEPLLSDRHTIMICLSLGQYLQEAHVKLRQELESLPNRLCHWFSHGHIHPPRSLPTVFIQIVLPEGRIRLHQVLRSMQDTNRDALDPSPSAYSAATAAGKAAAAAATKQLQQQGHYSQGSQGGTQSHADSVAAAGDAVDAYAELPPSNGDAYDNDILQHQHRQHHQEEVALEAGAAAGAAAAAKAASSAAAAGVSTAGTVTTAGIGGRDRSRSSRVQDGCADCATGAAYWRKYGHSVRVMCMSDVKHAMMAHTLLGVPGVMTLLSNLSTTADFGTESLSMSSAATGWMKDYMMGASQELYELVSFPKVLHGETFKVAAGFIYDRCRAVLLALEGTKGADRHHLGVADLEQVIQGDMRGYIVAEDIGAVVNIMSAQHEDFQLWQEQQLERQATYIQPPKQSAAEQARALHQQQWLPQWMQRAEQQQQGLGNECPGSKKGVVPVRVPVRRHQKESMTLAHPSGLSDDRDSWLFSLSSHITEQQPNQQLQSSSSLHSGPSLATAAAASAAVAAISTVGAIGHSSKDHTGALAAVVHLLRSPSHQLQRYGEAFMRQHYHLRRRGAIQSSQSMVVSAVPRGLSGHVLVLGVPRSQESLLALLAPLRSRRLSRLRPIVIIDAQTPGRGGCWDTLATFRSTYFIQMREGLNEALLNANAESASHAVLLSPLSAHEDEVDDNKLASKVLTDAMVIHMYQLLRSLNPHMLLVAELMLPQNMAYLAPMVPVRGVPRRQQVMLSPAFISGSVFMARTLDDLMIASYCNNTGDRIILQLLHRWHLAGRSITHMMQAIDACGDNCRVQKDQGPDQQQQQQHKGEQQRSALPDIESGLSIQDQDDSCAGRQQQQQQQQRRWHHVRFSGAGKTDSPGCCDGDDDGPGIDTSAAALANPPGMQAPTILLVPVDCPPNTRYSNYFHQLLWERQLLLLGVYRLVDQGGLKYRAALTNPYRSVMQPDDLAYVVSTLRFPEGVDGGAAAVGAAAWPADSLGFNNLVPPPADVPDPLDRVQDEVHQQQQQEKEEDHNSDDKGQQQQEQVDGEGERAGDHLSGCDELTASASSEAVEPSDSPGKAPQSPPRHHHTQQQQPERSGTSTSNTAPPGSAAAAAAAASSSTAPSHGRPTGSSRLSDNNSMPPSAHAFSPAPPPLLSIPPDSPFLVHDHSCEIHTPAGSASSGTLGPGISAVRQGAGAHDSLSHHMLVKTPGVTTTMPKAAQAFYHQATPGNTGPRMHRDPQGQTSGGDMTLK